MGQKLKYDFTGYMCFGSMKIITNGLVGMSLEINYMHLNSTD